MNDPSESPEEAIDKLADAILSVGRVTAICPPNLDCANFAEAIVIHAAVMRDGLNGIASAIERLAEAIEQKP